MLVGLTFPSTFYSGFFDNPQEKRLAADDPEVRVLHSIGHSAAPRLFPLAWTVLLLPLLLLQTP